jgi:hypothetical protein
MATRNINLCFCSASDGRCSPRSKSPVTATSQC